MRWPVPLLLFPLPAFCSVAAVNPPGWSTWLLSSLMVIGLILVLGLLLKKSQLVSAMGGGQMKVVASLPLGYKERLLVVKVGEQQLLLGVTPQQVNFLYRLDQPLAESASPPFSQQLNKLMGKHDSNM